MTVKKENTRIRRSAWLCCSELKRDFMVNILLFSLCDDGRKVLHVNCDCRMERWFSLFVGQCENNGINDHRAPRIQNIFNKLADRWIVANEYHLNGSACSAFL